MTVTGKIATISNRTEQHYSAGRFFPSKEYKSSVVRIAFHKIEVFLLQRERLRSNVVFDCEREKSFLTGFVQLHF